MHSSLTRYKLGLMGLFVLLIMLLGYVVVSSAGQRQDNLTQAKAELIADKLNDYTLDKSTVPENLDDLGVKDVPDTITYEKKTDTSYEFCATYKHASNDTPATGLEDVVTGAALGAYGAGYGSSDDYKSDSYLTLGKHTKGKNCQTIKLYGSSSSGINKPFESACEYDYAKSDDENEAYYTCIENQSRTQFN